MHNSLTVRSLAARRRVYRERAEAKRLDRASGIRLDVLVDILLRNPEWTGGRIVKGGSK